MIVPGAAPPATGTAAATATATVGRIPFRPCPNYISFSPQATPSTTTDTLSGINSNGNGARDPQTDANQDQLRIQRVPSIDIIAEEKKVLDSKRNPIVFAPEEVTREEA